MSDQGLQMTPFYSIFFALFWIYQLKIILPKLYLRNIYIYQNSQLITAYLLILL